MSEILGQADRAYRIEGLSAENPAQGMRAEFGQSAVTVSSGRGWLRLSTIGFGRAGAIRHVRLGAPRAQGNQVRYAGAALTESYVNGPLGLEQSFYLTRRPFGATPLAVAVRVAADLEPRASGSGVVFSGSGASLRYSDLRVLDARGRVLPSWLRVASGRLLLQIDDRRAVYPLRIDPFIQQGSKLVGTGGVGSAEQGTSVAVSSDGNTALVGGPFDDGWTGSVWVFTRSGSTWTQQGPKLTASDETGQGKFGESVSLSSDGDTALIGGSDDSGAGGAWVFTRSGSTWTQQGAKLTPSDETSAARFGDSVALSGDGNTALVGGSSDSNGTGAAWVFTRSGTTWTQQGSKLVGSGAVGGADQGSSVALSSDGTTALIGGPYDNGQVGAAWVFVLSGGIWTQQGSKLVGSGGAFAAAEGLSVALSGDGNTALIGEPNDNNAIGSASVFTRSGGTWTQQGPKLTASDETGQGGFGFAAALSADGNTALVGGDGDNSFAGAAWVFTRSGSIWTQHGSKLVGSGAVGELASQGTDVALSGDGSTALIGGPYDDNRSGATWAFTASMGAWSQQGSKLVGSGAGGNIYQGYSVALSGDGNTALVGGPIDAGGAFGGVGAAWVFTRSRTTWSQQGPKLTADDEVGLGMFGYSVALSQDGNTALIGGTRDNGNGAAWVFTRAGGTWTQQGAKLTPSGAATGGFGTSVALSGDGNTALISGGSTASVFIRSGTTWTQTSQLGETGSVALSGDGTTALVGDSADNGDIGAAWVFVQSGGTWTQQGPKLTAGDETGAGEFGASVALSSNGNTALIGGLYDNDGVGAAWVFTRSSGTWTQQGSKLVGSEAVGRAIEGYAVALASDGNTALIGGPYDNGGIGAAWVFTRSGSVWSQLGSKLVGSGGAGATQGQGYGVALSSDGNTALSGAPLDGGWLGAAWVFQTRNQSSISTQVDVATTGEPWTGVQPVGTSAVDTSAVTGISGLTPTGNVGYYLYGNNGCSGSPTSTVEVDLNSGAVPNSSATGGLSAGNYSFQAVYSGDGSYAGSTSSCEPFAVAAAPTATISAPPSGQTYGIGQKVATTFSCIDGQNGPGIKSCVDSNGSSTGSGILGTAKTGTFTYTVAARSNDGQTGTVSITYRVATVPVNTSAPVISGTPQVGHGLKCSTGSWAPKATGYSYGWKRNGTPIVGATSSGYTVRTIDEGSKLACVVTASNASGHGTPATSAAVAVPVRASASCPAPRGTASGATFGLLTLGMTRKQAEHAYRRSSDREWSFHSFFCLTPAGIGVGYASPRLLAALPASRRARRKDRVIWVQTANPYFAIDSVRRGATLTAAAQKLALDSKLSLGRDDWYFLTDSGNVTAVLRVRNTIVQSIAIVYRAFTRGSAAQRRLIAALTDMGVPSEAN